jgi:hypothetical protein
LSDYPTQKAWERVAKTLFPAVELVKTFPRDCWLIDNYCPPNETSPPNEIILKNQPASLLPGGITYISGMVSQGRTGFAPVYQDSGKIFPPKKLIAKVDQAYFRRSLREEVHRWFKKRGFDLKQRTISKEEFEKHLARKRVKPAKSDSDAVTNFVRDYLKNNPTPTLRGVGCSPEQTVAIAANYRRRQQNGKAWCATASAKAAATTI